MNFRSIGIPTTVAVGAGALAHACYNNPEATQKALSVVKACGEQALSHLIQNDEAKLYVGFGAVIGLGFSYFLFAKRVESVAHKALPLPPSIVVDPVDSTVASGASTALPKPNVTQAQGNKANNDKADSKEAAAEPNADKSSLNSNSVSKTISQQSNVLKMPPINTLKGPFTVTDPARASIKVTLSLGAGSLRILGNKVNEAYGKASFRAPTMPKTPKNMPSKSTSTPVGQIDLKLSFALSSIPKQNMLPLCQFFKPGQGVDGCGVDLHDTIAACEGLKDFKEVNAELAKGNYAAVFIALRSEKNDRKILNWLRSNQAELHGPLLKELAIAEFKSDKSEKTLVEVSIPLLYQGYFRDRQDAMAFEPLVGEDSSILDAAELMFQTYALILEDVITSNASIPSSFFAKLEDILLHPFENKDVVEKTILIAKESQTSPLPSPEWIGYSYSKYVNLDPKGVSVKMVKDVAIKNIRNQVATETIQEYGKHLVEINSRDLDDTKSN